MGVHGAARLVRRDHSPPNRPRLPRCNALSPAEDMSPALSTLVCSTVSGIGLQPLSSHPFGSSSWFSRPRDAASAPRRSRSKVVLPPETAANVAQPFSMSTLRQSRQRQKVPGRQRRCLLLYIHSHALIAPQFVPLWRYRRPDRWQSMRAIPSRWRCPESEMAAASTGVTKGRCDMRMAAKIPAALMGGYDGRQR